MPFSSKAVHQTIKKAEKQKYKEQWIENKSTHINKIIFKTRVIINMLFTKVKSIQNQIFDFNNLLTIHFIYYALKKCKC